MPASESIKRELLGQAEVTDGQTLCVELTGDGPVRGDEVGVLRVVGEDDRDLAEVAVLHAAVAERAAELQQAREAAAQLRRAVGHRDDEDEGMAAIVAASGDQGFQPPPCRLIRLQHMFIEAAVP